MMERLGRTEEAAHAYDRAAARARTGVEASFLSGRGRELEAGARARGEAAASC